MLALGAAVWRFFGLACDAFAKKHNRAVRPFYDNFSALSFFLSFFFFWNHFGVRTT
jgi:hypothetical protein